MTDACLVETSTTRDAGGMALDAPASGRSPAPTVTPTSGTNNLLLERLGRSDREALEPYLRPTSLTQGRVLFEPGEEIKHLHFPRSGAVSLVLMMGDGALVETMMVGREGVTDAGSYATARRATCRAVAQLPGEAWRIEAGRLREFAAERPGVRAVLERYAAECIGELERTAACNAVHRLEQRLARWLLRSHDRSDADVLPLTQEFLSEMLGAQRTTVTQVAGALQRAGALVSRRGRITVLDRAALERLSCECYAAGARREPSAGGGSTALP